MKPQTLLIILAGAVLMPGTSASAFAQTQNQNTGVKVTTTLHPDDTRTDLKKDFDAGTAEEKTYDAGGKLLGRATYKLDEQGQFTEGTAYSPKGTVLYQFTYTRNSVGQISEERDTTPDGKLIRRLVYHYDPNGHVAGIDGFDGNGKALPAADQPAGSKKKAHRN